MPSKIAAMAVMRIRLLNNNAPSLEIGWNKPVFFNWGPRNANKPNEPPITVVSKTKMNGDEFANKALEEYGVALVSGTSFGNSAKDFVRFSFANSKQNITKALKLINEMCI